MNYSIGCKSSKLIAILIQHIKNAPTLENWIFMAMDLDNGKLNNYELVCILYQIYMPLSILSDVYTHHDLHDNNILIYEPIIGSYITYKYHLDSDVIVQFKSRYIVKIIDYGSNYYNDGENNSKNTYDKICAIKDCNPRCGQQFGLGKLASTSAKKNMSHDLMLINYLKIQLNRSIISSDKLLSLFSKVLYSNHSEKIGFTKSGLPDIINNVNDACEALGELINNPDYTSPVLYSDESKNIGVFHINKNGEDMKFVKI